MLKAKEDKEKKVQEEMKINNILVDIENEFRELDDLLKEIDDISGNKIPDEQQ